jgi:hypothetical protein
VLKTGTLRSNGDIKWTITVSNNKCFILIINFILNPIYYLLTYLFTYLLTSCSRVILEKLTGSKLVKKFLAFYGTRRFITAFTSAHFKWVPVTMPWRVLRLRMEERPPVWRVAANIKKKNNCGQLTKGGSPAWGLGKELTIPYCKNVYCYKIILIY